jgi:hypothetical protein
MEFRRVEVKKTIRHQERVSDSLETRKIFEALKSNCLTFSIRVGTMGWLRECSVLEVGDESVKVFSRAPQKVRLTSEFKDIENVDVESNCDFLVEEDAGGRWARIV